MVCAGPARGDIPRGTTSLVDAEIAVVGDRPGQALGYGAGPAGDLDGDGFEDLVLGALRDAEAGVRAGAAFVFYGPVPAGRISAADADAKLLGELTGDYAGEGSAGLGDMDGDGLDDLAIGAPGREPALGQPGVPAPGAVYIFYGSRARLAGTISLASADAKLVGPEPIDFAGVAIATDTDMDGDGYSDLVIGAPGDDAAGPQAGAVYVVRGGRRRLRGTHELIDRAHRTLLGRPGDLAGFALERAGRVNADGYDDVLIGAPAYRDFGGDGLASTYLAYGRGSRPARRPAVQRLADTATRFLPDRSDEVMGSGLAGGDLDADGLDDVILGVESDDEGGADAGAAFVFYGRAPGFRRQVALRQAAAKLTGKAPGDGAGLSLAVADVDGDARGDLAIGAPFNHEGGLLSGAAYVVFGSGERLHGSGSLAAADATLLGEAPFNFAGAFVDTAGDLNGDGVADLMVVSLGHSPTPDAPGAGAVHVLYGGPAP